MKIYLKGFYGYKNFGDEVILFGLLNYLQKEYNPDEIILEVGDLEWIQSRLANNKEYLQPGIEDKIDFVENRVISKRFKQILSFLGINKYKKYFKIFGGGEVLDESRKFPHDGRNLVLLHHYSIRKRNFILVGGIGTCERFRTKKLFKYILHKAQKIICREKISYERAIANGGKNAISYEDFSKEIFKDSSLHSEGRGGVILNKTKGSEESINVNKDSSLYSQGQKKNILINISPRYFNEQNLRNIKNFVGNHSSDCKKIFFPADINIDKALFTDIRKIIPDLEIYDRTKHNLQDTIELFSTCIGGIGSRLHFLYPLKLFGKELENISSSDKVKKALSDR